MNCYECNQLDRATDAVAVCNVCGAAVCPEHVHSEPVQMRGPPQPGKVIHSRPARRLTCPVCRTAEKAT